MHQSLENHEHLIELFHFNQSLMKTKDTIHSNNQLLDSTRQVKHWQSSSIHLWITQHTSRYFSKWKSLDWFDGGFRFRWSPLDEQTASQLLSGSLRAGSGRRSCTKWSSGTHFRRNPSSCVVPAGLFPPCGRSVVPGRAVKDGITSRIRRLRWRLNSALQFRRPPWMFQWWHRGAGTRPTICELLPIFRNQRTDQALAVGLTPLWRISAPLNRVSTCRASAL